MRAVVLDILALVASSLSPRWASFAVGLFFFEEPDEVLYQRLSGSGVHLLRRPVAGAQGLSAAVHRTVIGSHFPYPAC